MNRIAIIIRFLLLLLPVGLEIDLSRARELLHRRWLRPGGDRGACLLLCPNLTLLALGASTLVDKEEEGDAAGWLLLTGLLMTVFSGSLLPAAGKGAGENGRESGGAPANRKALQGGGPVQRGPGHEPPVDSIRGCRAGGGTR